MSNRTASQAKPRLRFLWVYPVIVAAIALLSIVGGVRAAMLNEWMNAAEFILLGLFVGTVGVACTWNDSSVGG